MSMQGLLRRTFQTLADNSSVLLTGAAVAGTVTTAIFSAKGHTEAVIENANASAQGRDHAEDGKEFIKRYWRCYIPAATSGAVTISCIIGIHSVNTRRQAALISAYSVVDKAFTDYREKVVETIGERQENKVKDEVAKKNLEENPVGDNEVFITGTGEQLCYDSFTGRYFKSDIETIRKAQNDVNAQVINDMYCSQNEFYHKIGLAPAAIGEEFGWTTDRFMEINFSTHLSEDGRPCLSLEFIPGPIRNYWRVS